MLGKVLPVAAAASPLAIAALLSVLGSSTTGLEAVSRQMLLGAVLILAGIVFSAIMLARSRGTRDRVLSLIGVIGNIGLGVLAVMQSRPA